MPISIPVRETPFPVEQKKSKSSENPRSAWIRRKETSLPDSTPQEN
jgi:hypothetical protein